MSFNHPKIGIPCRKWRPWSKNQWWNLKSAWVVLFNVHLSKLHFNTGRAFKPTMFNSRLNVCVKCSINGLLACLFQSVRVPRSSHRQWPVRPVRRRLLTGAVEVRCPADNNDLWLRTALISWPTASLLQVGREKDKGQAENQQSPVWGSFLLRGTSELIQCYFVTAKASFIFLFRVFYCSSE